MYIPSYHTYLTTSILPYPLPLLSSFSSIEDPEYLTTLYEGYEEPLLLHPQNHKRTSLASIDGER